MERRLKVKSGGVLNSEAFFEASREELRVLVAIMEKPLAYSSDDEVGKAAGVSKGRAAAAITLFLEAGVIVREGDVSYEFEKRSREDDIIERSSAEVAETIRKKNLADLFSELAAMMGKETLNTDEIKKLTSLTEDLVLTEEYVMMLAEFLSSKERLSVKNLLKEAAKLDKMDVHTPERLEEYLKMSEGTGSLEWQFRSTFQKYGQKLSKSELDYFRKWTEVFGFSSEIVLLALDVNVRSKTNYSYAYMDTLLERWHECGCKTLEDCKRQAESDRARIAEEKRRDSTVPQRTKKSEAPAPRFGDFDPNEALKRAIEKSFAKYGSDEEKK